LKSSVRLIRFVGCFFVLKYESEYKISSKFRKFRAIINYYPSINEDFCSRSRHAKKNNRPSTISRTYGVGLEDGTGAIPKAREIFEAEKRIISKCSEIIPGLLMRN